MELSHSQKLALGFGGAFVVAGIVLSILVFPFWNFIREDVYEDVVILNNDTGICYVDTLDGVPKPIENCDLKAGAKATIRFGEGLAWAEIVQP